jgi:hypothetical protein
VKLRYRIIATTLGLLLALTATLATAAGRSSLPLRGQGVTLELPAAQLATCTAMEATSEVRWLATDEAGELTDEEVTEYPSETVAIGAIFDYNCVPKSASIVTVFSIDGEVVFSNKAPQKASSKPNSYSYVISREDGSPVPDGEWEVSFFNNKTLLASGAVTVGGEGPAPTPEEDAIEVQGSVTDAKTKKPIKGALVIVLNEGVTAEAFVDDPQDEDVFASAQTDARGEFVLDQLVEKTVEHSWIIAAKGYKPIVKDALVVGEDAEDPLILNVTLSK